MYCSNCGCASGLLKPTQDGVLMCPLCHEKKTPQGPIYLTIANLLPCLSDEQNQNTFISSIDKNGICSFSLNNPPYEILSADLNDYTEVERVVVTIQCFEKALCDLRKFIEQNYVVTTFP